MEWKKLLLKASILLNIFCIVIFGYLIAQKGGMSYLTVKASSVLGFESNTEFKSTNPDYLKKQSLFELLTIKEGSTVFLGDSITAGNDWAEVLRSLEYVNRGIPGDDSTGILERSDKIVKSKPKSIFIMTGVNDLSATGDPSKLLKNYNEIIDKIQRDSPNTKIFIQSILPINTNKYKAINKTKMSNKIIRDTNIELNKMSEGKHVTFIDLYSLMSKDHDELNPDYTLDGIHLSGDAYMVWIDAIKKYLN